MRYWNDFGGFGNGYGGWGVKKTNTGCFLQLYIEKLQQETQSLLLTISAARTSQSPPPSVPTTSRIPRCPACPDTSSPRPKTCWHRDSASNEHEHTNSIDSTDTHSKCRLIEMNHRYLLEMVPLRPISPRPAVLARTTERPDRSVRRIVEPVGRRMKDLSTNIS